MGGPGVPVNPFVSLFVSKQPTILGDNLVSTLCMPQCDTPPPLLKNSGYSHDML